VKTILSQWVTAVDLSQIFCVSDHEEEAGITVLSGQIGPIQDLQDGALDVEATTSGGNIQIEKRQGKVRGGFSHHRPCASYRVRVQAFSNPYHGRQQSQRGNGHRL
jgi:hypothetical protein